MKVKIKKLDPSIELPKYHTTESAAFDIAANEDAVLKPGEKAKIKTGLVIEAPDGHFLLVAARSSLGLKKGLMFLNGIGVVDRDYAGPSDEIHILLHNFSSQDVEIKKGERLAQGMFIRVDQAEWEEVSEIRPENRGGYGSTGGYKTV